MWNILLAALFAIAIAAPVMAKPATGSIHGRVFVGVERDAGAYANVAIPGVGLGAMADADGRFRIDAVPAGSHRVRVLLLGHPAVDLRVEVGASDTKLADVILDSRFVEIVMDSSWKHPEPLHLGARAAVSAGDLVASIRFAKTLHVGDTPAFQALIHNVGSRPARLVRSVEGSERGASPNVSIEVIGPPGGYFARGVTFCGNLTGVRGGDVVWVAPGGWFDPFAGGQTGGTLRYGSFHRPGRYTATFRYITTDTDPRRWMQSPCDMCSVPASLRALLEAVPAVDLVATTTFDVAP